MDGSGLGRLDEVQRDPYPLYARAHRAQGLLHVPELDAWLVARDADVREVLRRAEDFSSAGSLRPDVLPSPAALAVLGGGFGGRPVIVGSDGEAHQRLRLPIVRGLSPARVAAVLPYAAERAAALVGEFAGGGTGGSTDGGAKEVAGGGRVELMAAYARRLPGEVVGRIVGLDPADVPAVVRGGHRAEELLFRPLAQDEQIAAAEDVVALQHLLDRYARERAADPREDLCSEIVASVAPVPGELTLEQRHEAVSHLQNLLIAGHLTTTALIGTTVLHLLRHPRQWELLCAEPERIPAAVEEAARYDGALQGFRRVTTRPVTLAGTELPAGASLFVAFGGANRDALRHPRADVFDITRRPGRHLAFGHGPHACPGAQLAREQLRLTLGELTRRLPGLRLADPDRPVAMRPTMIHRSPHRLDLAW